MALSASQALARPLILTLALPQKVMSRLDALRRAHYPLDRNRVPAHLGLFRHLPGTQIADILQAVQSEAVRTPPFKVEIGRATSWQGAVVLPVRSAELHDLHDRLRDRFLPLLIPADRAPFRPHVTLANRLLPGTQSAVLAAVSDAWPRPLVAEALGLFLWRYDEGPWSLLVRTALRR